MATKIVEQCQVAPSSGAPTQQSLKLSHMDIVFLPLHPIQKLFFYSLQCSESPFLDTIVPSLKDSLSLTLKHFLPLVGKIIAPIITSQGLPVSRYVAGDDSFPLTIAISNADFVILTGKHSRPNADDFRHVVPHLPLPTHSPDSIRYSVASVQVTLFPNQGVCIGFTIHHAIGDGITVIGFFRTWALIAKLKGDDHLLASGEKRLLPFYDRDVVKDADRLAAECWNNVKTMCSRPTSFSNVPTYKVRATFVLCEAEIQQLKNFVLLGKKTARASSFVVVCAHVWTCLAKAAVAAGEDMADDKPTYLSCGVNSRGLLNPPLPDNYFGNCLKFLLAESTNGKLKATDGLLAAAEAIGDAIHKTIVNNEIGIMDGSEQSFMEIVKRMGKKVLLVGIIGTPRFDMYAMDYGFGRPIKFENLLVHSGEVSIFKSREFERGVEIGLSMEKDKMDAFTDFLNQGLTEVRKCIMITSKC